MTHSARMTQLLDDLENRASFYEHEGSDELPDYVKSRALLRVKPELAEMYGEIFARQAAVATRLCARFGLQAIALRELLRVSD